MNSDKERHTDRGATNGCPSGKIGYRTRRAAKHAHRYYKVHDHQRVYRCPSCDLYHTGHLPGRVVAGDTTADKHYRRNG